MIGRLTVVCGPMFAGKSTELLKRVLWAREGIKRPVVVFKPAFDNRYAETEIVSHDGLRTPAESIMALPAHGDIGGSLVVFDEVQFFSEPYVSGDVVAWIKEALGLGADVVCAGLDMDWQRDPFPITANLLAMADESIKLGAKCHCGSKAAFTYKKSLSGDKVALGGSDTYEARCHEHWGC